MEKKEVTKANNFEQRFLFYNLVWDEREYFYVFKHWTLSGKVDGGSITICS